MNIDGKNSSAWSAKKMLPAIWAVCLFGFWGAASAFALDGELYALLTSCSERRALSEWNARVEQGYPMEIGLQGADFVDAYLEKADLRSADLRGADFRSADLRGANLSSADLRGADFRSADLRGADLRGADLRGTDLAGASIGGIDVRGARFPQGST